MKKSGFLSLFIITILIGFSGCSEKNPISTATGGVGYNIAAWNYSDNHYFLDTSYKSNFIDWAYDGELNAAANISRDVSNEYMEVWVQSGNSSPGRKFASLLIDLPPLVSGEYDTSFYKPQLIQGRRYFGFFRKLTPDEFYINYHAGFIGLKINIPENDYLAVSYKETGTQRRYGTSNSPRDTLVLKMIKAGNVNPQTDELAWALKMKNVYRIPVEEIFPDGFEFRINYTNPSTNIPNPDLPNGQRVLKVVQLDRFIGNGPMLGADNLFDYIPGRTVIAGTGDIIFPVLEPFYNEIFAATGDSTLAFKEIYTKLKTEVSILPGNSKYNIEGKVRGIGIPPQ